MLKIGVFGAYRGKCMIDIAEQYDGVSLVAVCDRYVPLLKEVEKSASEHGIKVALYTDFEEFFKHDMDAVILANYAHEHAPYAVRLLKSGRHVASEVLAFKSLAEAVELIEAVEESGKVYSYFENYCYFPATTELRRLYKTGTIGQLKHAEGEYVHNCEHIWRDITYAEREHWRNRESSVFYCTHGFGPIIHSTGLRPVKVTGFDTTPSVRMMSQGNPRPDSGMIAAVLNNGATVRLLQGNLLREPGSIWYCMYGSDAYAESDRYDGVGKVRIFENGDESMRAYTPAPAVDNELSRRISTHGGGDFYTMYYFINAILGDKDALDNIVNVYEAVDMTIVGTLAWRSICEGNVTLDVPDLRIPAVRDKYRFDRKCVIGDGEDREYNPYRLVSVPNEVYAARRSEWEAAHRE